MMRSPARSSLKSDIVSGLTSEEAQKRLGIYGPNALACNDSRSTLNLLLDQFKDFMIFVLLAAAVVFGVLNGWKDTLVILIIVALNTGIGFTRVQWADQAITAMHKLTALKTTVVRDATTQAIVPSSLVP